MDRIGDNNDKFVTIFKVLYNLNVIFTKFLWIMDKIKSIGYNSRYMQKYREGWTVMHYKKSVFRSLAMITQLGLCVITPVFLCVFIGYQVDSHLGGFSLVKFFLAPDSFSMLQGSLYAFSQKKARLFSPCQM